MNKMTPDDISYRELVSNLRRDPEDIMEDLDKRKVDLIHMAMGIAGEAGELLDAIKKHCIYGLPLNEDNVIEELGDLEFYIEGMRQILVIQRGLTTYENKRKLLKRYPNGFFEKKAAKERKDKIRELVAVPGKFYEDGLLSCKHPVDCRYFHASLKGGMRFRCCACDDPEAKTQKVQELLEKRILIWRVEV